jgi:tetratricopeptide (TPR) repeat protein
MVGALLGGSAVRHAAADTPPSIWDKARDVGSGDRWRLHVRIERMLSAPVPDDMLPGEVRRERELRIEAARALLEQADAAHDVGSLLRFDLGEADEQLATVTQRDDLYEEAVAILDAALQEDPDAPGATRALESLADAYAHLGRAAVELPAWRRYVARLWDDPDRAGALMNMGEAEQRLGLLTDALTTFRTTLDICRSLGGSSSVNSTYALALWDMAITLDRSGDWGAAIETAGRARAFGWTEIVGSGAARHLRSVTGWDAIRDDESVFFVPPWEREWYLGLGDAAVARAAGDPADAAVAWESAEGHWNTYVERSAEAGGRDLWLPLARARRAAARAAKAEAARRALRQPPPQTSGTEEPR